MSKVWSLDLPHNQLWVLMALADYADDDGYCWPSAPKLAHKTGYSERQIRRLVDGLIEGGTIFQNQRDGRSSETWLKLDNAPGKAAFTPDKMTGGKGASSINTPDIAMSPLTPAKMSGHPCQNVTPTPDILSATPDIAMSPITISNQSVEPIKEPSEPSASVARRKEKPQDPLFNAIAEAWKGEPYRPGLLTRGQASLVGIAAAELREVGAMPEDVPGEWQRINAKYDDISPKALSQHWGTTGSRRATVAARASPPDIDSIRDPFMRALIRQGGQDASTTDDIHAQNGRVIDQHAKTKSLGPGVESHGTNLPAHARDARRG